MTDEETNAGNPVAVLRERYRAWRDRPRQPSPLIREIYESTKADIDEQTMQKLKDKLSELSRRK